MPFSLLWFFQVYATTWCYVYNKSAKLWTDISISYVILDIGYCRMLLILLVLLKYTEWIKMVLEIPLI